jgi:hypothetical protein
MTFCLSQELTGKAHQSSSSSSSSASIEFALEEELHGHLSGLSDDVLLVRTRRL